MWVILVVTSGSFWQLSGYLGIWVERTFFSNLAASNSIFIYLFLLGKVLDTSNCRPILDRHIWIIGSQSGKANFVKKLFFLPFQDRSDKFIFPSISKWCNTILLWKQIFTQCYPSTGSLTQQLTLLIFQYIRIAVHLIFILFF